jgi:LmbE family N-acetylglucosaminyl deacetylase
MSSLIFCAHTDDAIFSLGDHIIDNDHSFTIASAFAGIPKDWAGYRKHIRLRQEHDEACSMINAKAINGDLLDDVYGEQNKNDLIDWIKSIIINFDNVYIPLGIHHPDHILLSDTLFELMKDFNKTYFIYAELPYRMLYPKLHKERLKQFESIYTLENIPINFTQHKIDAIKKYNSQVAYVHDPSYINEDLVGKLIVEEKLWKVLK